MRKNKLINAESEENAPANVLIQFNLRHSKRSRRNRKQLILVGTAGLHGIYNNLFRAISSKGLSVYTEIYTLSSVEKGN